MKQSNWEVVILKPTSLFLSFLSSQLPDTDLPELHLLQTDTTAYLIPKKNDDEETLMEIERHFPVMFRHEINRWLGENSRNEIETSFLDFLCCFKFELHSQIALFEPSIDKGRQLFCVKPRTVVFQWMKSAVEAQSELITILEQVNLSQVTENATVVIKNFTNLKEIKKFIRENYEVIFKAEMQRMSDREEQWPVVDSFEKFIRYFSIEIHTQLVHLH